MTDLIVRQQVKRSCQLLNEAYRLLAPPRISGGSDDDPELVTGVLAGRAAMCADCIAAKVGMAATEMRSLIVRLAKTLPLETSNALCDECLITRRVYRLRTPMKGAGKRGPGDYLVTCSCGYEAYMRTLGQAAADLTRHLDGNTDRDHSATIRVSRRRLTLRSDAPGTNEGA